MAERDWRVMAERDLAFAVMRNDGDYEPLSDEVEQVERHQQDRIADEKDNTVQIVRTYEGRAVIWRLLQVTHLDELPYVQGSQEDTAFNCGLQKAGKWAKDELLTHAPETYTMMEIEAREREQRYAAEAKLPRGTE